MAHREQVQVADAVEARLVAPLLSCPDCGAVYFRKGGHYAFRADGSEELVRTEVQCLGCNHTYDLESLRTTNRTTA